jgi:hypothetical protein
VSTLWTYQPLIATGIVEDDCELIVAVPCLTSRVCRFYLHEREQRTRRVAG